MPQALSLPNSSGALCSYRVVVLLVSTTAAISLFAARVIAHLRAFCAQHVASVIMSCTSCKKNKLIWTSQGSRESHCTLPRLFVSRQAPQHNHISCMKREHNTPLTSYEGYLGRCTTTTDVTHVADALVLNNTVGVNK